MRSQSRLNGNGERQVGEIECVKPTKKKPVVQRARYSRSFFFNPQ